MLMINATPPKKAVNQNVICQLLHCPIIVPNGTPMTLAMVKPENIEAMIVDLFSFGMTVLAMDIDRAVKTPLTTAVVILEPISTT